MLEDLHVYRIYTGLCMLYEENQDCCVTTAFKIFQEFLKLAVPDFTQFCVNDGLS